MVAMADESVPFLEPPKDGGSSGKRWRACSWQRVIMYIITVTMLLYDIFCVQANLDAEKVASFSMGLNAFGGVNATTGLTVSPWFVVTAKVENPRAWQAWCSLGGDVVVSYDGVSLAWGRVPGFCVPRKGVLELTAAAAGKGVGLSEDLRRRFMADQSAGTAQVVADMKLFYDGNGWSAGMSGYEGVSLVSRQLALRDQNHEASVHQP